MGGQAGVSLAPKAGLAQSMVMTGRIAALYRHPVKGFTPEPVAAAEFLAGGCFPYDRVYSVENGPSGFDPAAPAHLPKSRFTVLARIPQLARARTAYDEASGELSAQAHGRPPLRARLTTAEGRAAFEAWLAAFLEAEAPGEAFGPLKVLAAPGAHRFMDSRKGFVSVLNLQSLRDLERHVGRPVDPARFRANVHVDGWPAWSEYGLEPGKELTLGAARLSLTADIDRCMATHVDPGTGVRDIDMVGALTARRGHICCGVYFSIETSGRVAVGDAAEWAA